MNEQVLTEYIKALLDQRANLELQVIQLRKQIADNEQVQQTHGKTEETGSPQS